MANESDPLTISVIMIGAGSFLFYKGFSWRRQKSLIENTPTSKIRSIAMGRTEITGTVVPHNNAVYKTPFSDVECVYCRYSIEERRGSGKNSHWHTILSRTIQNHFYLKDDTDQVLVDPDEAQISTSRKNTYNSNIPDHAIQFMKSNGLSNKGFLGFNKNLRLTETYIIPGEQLFIMGEAGDNPFIKDGSSDKNSKDVMIQKGKSEFYYISDKEEKSVLKTLKWKVFGGLFGGGMLILLGLLIMFSFFGVL